MLLVATLGPSLGACSSEKNGPGCVEGGGSCRNGTDCCSNRCVALACVECNGEGASCETTSDCCPNAGLSCFNGACSYCKLQGASCAITTECCSNSCTGGTCDKECSSLGGSCQADNECCSKSNICEGHKCTDPGETGDDQCSDGIDNDSDGDKDCFDSRCRGVSVCVGDGSAEDSVAKCSDGIDNDNNGWLDCDDFSCKYSTDKETSDFCAQ